MSITRIGPDDVPPTEEPVRQPKRIEQPSGDLVQWFLDYYWIRHPISKDSIAAYRADLLALERWLSVFRNKTLIAASKRDLREYLETGYNAGSRGRRDLPSLSCIKRFYFYLVEVGLRADDPTEQVYVRTPRLVRSNLEVIRGSKN